MLRKHTIHTSHADIAVAETSGTGMPVVLIHGNSCSKSVFVHQLESAAGADYRMIAFDLPGHGDSSNAFDPDRTYSLSGLADATMEVLQALGVDRAIVYGWSLGGHVAIELMPRFAGLAGLMLTATPPVHPDPESFMGGFRMHPVLPLIGQEVLSDAEVDTFANGVFGPAASDAFRRDIRRADGRCRRLVIATAFTGGSSDQRTLVETSQKPVALVNGENDPIVNVDYLGSLVYANLWEKHNFVLRGEGHAPFLTNPQLFNPIFDRFLKDVAAAPMRATGTVGRTAAA